MEQLIAHLVGDYVLQNHWMANNKTKAWLPAIVHVVLYGLPFLLLTRSPAALAIIVLTHLIIDHYRLASYWVDFWGTGKAGWLPNEISRMRHVGKFPEPWNEENAYIPLCVRLQDAPAWLGVWLLIIVDNTMHLTINYLTLRFLG